MKTILQVAIIFIAIISFTYGQANTTLSNLASPTAVNQNLIPNNNNGRDLGSAAKSWRSFYIDSNVYLRDVRFIHNTGTQNAFVGDGAGTAITKGKNNAAFGYHALYATKTQSFNAAFGSFALANNTGVNNSAFGYHALGLNGAGANNTATGYEALYHNTTGSSNTANGVYALTSNETGDINTANGYRSLYFNTTGEQNTATGYAALENNNGNYNSAHGTAALNNNSTGAWNTANGAYAMRLNTTGYNNTATGGNALYSNMAGANNTAYGYNALYNNTADNNTAIGTTALYANTAGGGNTAIGLEALRFNTEGDYNTAIGQDALLNNTTGHDNTANGGEALLNNNTGSYNTANGVDVLYNNITGSYNTANGNQALANNTTGSGNTAIGYAAGAEGSGNYSYSSAFGSRAPITGSQQVRIGSLGYPEDPTSIGGKVDWSTLSDVRVKKNIKENVPGLIFINKLKPVTYTVDNDAINKIIQRPVIKDKDGNIIKRSADEVAAGKANAAIVYTGFAAQEVEKVARSLNYDFSGVDAAKNDKDLYGLRYGEFVVPLVKAVQELSKENDSLKSRNTMQEKINADLQKQINELKAMIVSGRSTDDGQQSTVISSASLQQNIPNPFTHSTTIGYTLPANFSSAKIIITDKAGKALKEINVSGNKGPVNIDASTLASGAYQYSLLIDGRLIDTRQMVIAK